MTNLYVEPFSTSIKIPTMATDHSACYDVYADLNGRDVTMYNVGKKVVKANCRLELYPGDRAIIPTGLKMCCDPGWKIELAPRSGNAIKKGLTLINCVGIVDADYRHEVGILLVNSGIEVVVIEDTERVAQLSLEKVYPVNMIIGQLPETNSNRDGGMGSTGA